MARRKREGGQEREGGAEPAGAGPAIVLESGAGPVVEIEGQRLLYLGGTNYLGMSRHPRVIEALVDAAARWGISAGGGRTTSGTALPHLELEAALAGFLGAETVVIAATGYQANAVVLQACREKYDVALVDELAHSSVIDAARASGLPETFFRHHDAEDAARQARSLRAGGKRPVMCVDGAFPVDGTLAPLAEHLRTARELELGLLVDDAHGVGVLGTLGRGTPEHLGIGAAGILLTGSLSKAFGVFGGFASGPGELVRLAAQSGAYVGTTPLPPALAAAASRSVAIVRGEPALRERLLRNADRMKQGLRALGLEFPETPMPIARFVVGDAATGRRLHAELRRKGVLVPFNTYPGGPSGGYFRLAVSAAHSPEQLEEALDALRSLL